MKKVTRKRIGGFKTHEERKANRAVLKANKQRPSTPESEKEKWALVKKYERILETGQERVGEDVLPLGRRIAPFITSKGKVIKHVKKPDVPDVQDKWSIRCGQPTLEDSDKSDEWEEYHEKLVKLRRELMENVRKKR